MRASAAQGQHACWCATARTENRFLEFFRNTEDCVGSFRGFPPAVTQLKRVLDRMHPTLPKENPGSKWPKTSLGALRDDKRLTPDQLQHLLRICREEGAHLRSGALHPLEVNRAALCIFECRFSSFASWLNNGINGPLLCT